jgi:hypothetical protein
MGTTAELSEKIVATRYETLTREAVITARRLVLDGLRRIGIDTFTYAKVREPAIVELLGSVTLKMDPAVPTRFDPVHVEARPSWRTGAACTRAATDRAASGGCRRSPRPINW